MLRVTAALLFVALVATLTFAGFGEEAGGEGSGGFIVGEGEVKDGDSLIVAGEEVRLLGIDAPEYEQICGGGEGKKKRWRCGEEAMRVLEGVVGGREVRCELLFRDAHERWLSRCFVGGEGGKDGEDLAKIMVDKGMALGLKKEYRSLMRESQARGDGIWGGCLEKPEQWRKGRRTCWFPRKQKRNLP